MTQDPEAQDYLDLIRAACEQGRESVLNPKAAYALAFDTGFGASQEHRAFVACILAGYAKGVQARKELAADLTRPKEKEMEAS
jgi:hypothetical protein